MAYISGQQTFDHDVPFSKLQRVYIGNYGNVNS